MMSVAHAWKNRITLILSLITVSFLSGCTTFQSQKTTETSVPVKQGEMKQISPEVREKIALEAQKAIPAKSPLELEKVTASVEEKPLKKETVPAVQYGKREGTIAGVKYRYEGDLLGNVYHGKGKLSYANGFSYEGEFKNGQYDGYGIATDPKRKWRYEGQFKEGRYEGQGTLTSSNGDRYEGEFRQGKRHGQGVLIKANGQRREGKFVDDKFVK